MSESNKVTGYTFNLIKKQQLDFCTVAMNIQKIIFKNTITFKITNKMKQVNIKKTCIGFIC